MSGAKYPAKLVEKVARAVCSYKCQGARIRNDPCIDAMTTANAPCRATLHQLYLGGEWEQATRALDAIPYAAMREALEKIATENIFLPDTSAHSFQQIARAAIRAADGEET